VLASVTLKKHGEVSHGRRLGPENAPYELKRLMILRHGPDYLTQIPGVDERWEAEEEEDDSSD
jgi:hypothetical protein